MMTPEVKLQINKLILSCHVLALPLLLNNYTVQQHFLTELKFIDSKFDFLLH